MPSAASDRQRRKVASLMERLQSTVTTLPPKPPQAEQQTSTSAAADNKRPQPENGNDDDPEQALKRSFARFARSTPVTLKKRRYYHFDDAARRTAPPWPPLLVHDFVLFYCSERARENTRELMATLAAAYRKVRGRSLPSMSFKAGRAGIKGFTNYRGLDLGLDLPALLALSAATFSPAYKATFRARFDVALYTALACATGLGSSSFLGGTLRWRDFALWATRDGLQALYFSPTYRPFRLQDGGTLALSAAKLVAVGMALDGVLADCTLEQVCMWGGAERQVNLDADK